MVYDPKLLILALNQPQSRRLLCQEGYAEPTFENLPALLELLAKRMQQGSFPHEIGLFLGYPPEDVDGFIRHGGRRYRLAGPWKVYGSVARAKKLFGAYDACRATYLARCCSLNSLAEVLAAGQ